jgi:hypothetical protein
VIKPSTDTFDRFDYPAAHSMDTTWFAIDKDGFVALMESEEEGAVPIAYMRELTNGEEIVDSLTAHTGRKIELGRYNRVKPESLGLYGFTSNMFEFPPSYNPDGERPGDIQGIVPPYRRSATPENPLHVSELPPDLQVELKTLVFSDVAFRDIEWLQPVLNMPCQIYWGRKNKKKARAVDTNGAIVNVPPELFPSVANRASIVKDLPSAKVRALPWWQKLFGQ